MIERRSRMSRYERQIASFYRGQAYSLFGVCVLSLCFEGLAVIFGIFFYGVITR